MNTGETIALIKALGGGGSSLPPVTPSDNGKVLGVVDGEWAASEQGKKFIVTLTPTDLDYSGTMDKTVAEINAAYEAGMEIVFRVDGSGAGLSIWDCTVNVVENVGDEYPSFQSQVLLIQGNMYLGIYTPSTNTGTEAVYGVYAYSLTPAS